MLTVGICIWMLVSWLETGYDIGGGKVTFHTFNNAIWRVVRRDLKGADPKSFRTLSRSGGKYGADNQQMFFEGVEIVGAAPGTFEVLDWRQGFGRDHQHVYYRRIKVSDDPDSFQSLTKSYSKDSQRVYYMHHVVEGADPDTFVVTSEVMSQAKDKHGIYHGRKRKE